MRFRWLLIVILSLMPTVSMACIPAKGGSCEQRFSDGTRIIVQYLKDNLVFSLVNESDSYRTYSLDLKSLSNVSPQGDNETSHFLMPGARKEFNRLDIDNTMKPYDYSYLYGWMFGRPDTDTDYDDVIYLIPYEKHKYFRCIQGFNGSYSHTGDDKYAVDWAMPVGTKIRAARAGTVVATEDRHGKGGGNKAKYNTRANYVAIEHSDRTIASYFHLHKNGVFVRVGQKVKAGEIIGDSGNSGYSTTPHLHFVVHSVVDGFTRIPHPFRFISKEGIFDEPTEGMFYLSDY